MRFFFGDWGRNAGRRELGRISSVLSAPVPSINLHRKCLSRRTINNFVERYSIMLNNQIMSNHWIKYSVIMWEPIVATTKRFLCLIDLCFGVSFQFWCTVFVFPDRLLNHNSSHDTISLIVSLHLIVDKRALSMPHINFDIHITFIGCIHGYFANIKSLEITIAHYQGKISLLWIYNLERHFYLIDRCFCREL